MNLILTETLIRMIQGRFIHGLRCFLSQHYNPKSAPSTLAALLPADLEMKKFELDEDKVGDWIKQNCRRIDILIDSGISVFARNLIEAAFYYRFEL